MKSAVTLLFCLVLVACQQGPQQGFAAPTALEQHGLKLLSAKQYAEARGVFRQAFDTNSRSLVAVLGVAQAAVGCGDRGEAEGALRHAMETAPRGADAQALIGRAALQMAWVSFTADPVLARQYATIAARFLQGAAQRNPELPGLALQLGTAQMLAGKLALAEPLLLRAFDQERSAHVAALLTRCWNLMGTPDRAKTLLESLRKAGPVDLGVEAALSAPAR